MRSDLICPATARSSASSQSVASPSVMLKTIGGKLSAWAGSAHHAAAMSRTRRRASHIGVCPAASGSTLPGREFRAGRCCRRQPVFDDFGLYRRLPGRQLRHGDQLPAARQQGVDLVVARVSDHGDVVVVPHAVAAAARSISSNSMPFVMVATASALVICRLRNRIFRPSNPSRRSRG